MKVSIQTLGCKVNQSESANIEGALHDNNFEIVRHSDNPDVLIINTCTVTAKSDYQSRQMIRKAIRSGARVIATGCYAQIKPGEISKIEGLNLILGNSSKSDLVDHIRTISEKKGDVDADTIVKVDSPDRELTAQPYHSWKSRAFLKIQDGCNFSCSYCTIPKARGYSRSLTRDDVIKVAEKMSADGYLEIVVTGIHIGTYGLDLRPRISLVDLLNELISSFPHIRFRLSSIEPQEFSTEFLKMIERGGLCPHLHIPLQSGSDSILKAMNRGYTKKIYKQTINKILTEKPDLSIGTDLITGFPGETDNEFDETVSYIEQLGLSYLHVFPYSKRSGTPASTFKDQINEDVKKRRVKQLIDLGNKIKYNHCSKHLHSLLDVIIESRPQNSQYFNALSDNYLKIKVKSDRLKPGQRATVKVLSLTEGLLIAEPIEN